MESKLQLNIQNLKYPRANSPYTIAHKNGKHSEKNQAKKGNNLSINTSNFLVKELQSLDLNPNKPDRNSWITKDGNHIFNFQRKQVT